MSGYSSSVSTLRNMTGQFCQTWLNWARAWKRGKRVPTQMLVKLRASGRRVEVQMPGLRGSGGRTCETRMEILKFPWTRSEFPPMVSVASILDSPEASGMTHRRKHRSKSREGNSHESGHLISA